MAEVEILPHHHQPGTEGIDQDLRDELLGGFVGPLPVEGDDHGAVDPGRLEQLELLVEVT
jgi:hypothetical protein